MKDLKMNYTNYKIKKINDMLFELEITKDNNVWKTIAHGKHEAVKAIANLYFNLK